MGSVSYDADYQTCVDLIKKQFMMADVPMAICNVEVTWKEASMMDTTIDQLAQAERDHHEVHYEYTYPDGTKKLLPVDCLGDRYIVEYGSKYEEEYELTQQEVANLRNQPDSLLLASTRKVLKNNLYDQPMFLKLWDDLKHLRRSLSDIMTLYKRYLETVIMSRSEDILNKIIRFLPTRMASTVRHCDNVGTLMLTLERGFAHTTGNVVAKHVSQLLSIPEVTRLTKGYVDTVLRIFSTMFNSLGRISNDPMTNQLVLLGMLQVSQHFMKYIADNGSPKMTQWHKELEQLKTPTDCASPQHFINELRRVLHDGLKRGSLELKNPVLADNAVNKLVAASAKLMDTAKVTQTERASVVADRPTSNERSNSTSVRGHVKT